MSGTLTWQNSGVVDVYGYASIGASSADTVSIVNQAGVGKLPCRRLLFHPTTNGALVAGNAGKAVFTNAGTLNKTGGTGTSSISMVVNSTGVLGASTGTLALTGGRLNRRHGIGRLGNRRTENLRITRSARWPAPARCLSTQATV